MDCGGGEHDFFKHPGCNVCNSAGTLGPGLDIRGDGGYVVAPPSIHTSGKEYKWLIDARVPLADMPKCLFRKPIQTREKTKENQQQKVFINEGERDNTLTSMAGAMRNKGMGYEAIYAALQKENETRCVPPLPDADVKRIFHYI